MKLWTYLEIRNEVEKALGIEDEDFISSETMMGFCNSGIEKAEKIIHTLYEDYFLSYAKIALVNGQSEYSLPSDIFAHKIRGLTYNDGSLVYPIRKLKEKQKFELIGESKNFDYQWYRYYLLNRNGASKLVLLPKAHETMPTTSLWVSGQAYYLGDIVYYNEHRYQSLLPELWLASESYTAGELVIHSGRRYSCSTPNSDAVFNAANWTDLGVETNDTVFTASHWTDLGEETFYLTLFYLRNANRMTSDSSVCDLPEFTSYVIQYMKNECYKKENNGECPQAAKDDLEKLELEMESTLSAMIPDSDNELELDTSFYEEFV